MSTNILPPNALSTDPVATTSLCTVRSLKPVFENVLPISKSSSYERCQASQYSLYTCQDVSILVPSLYNKLLDQIHKQCNLLVAALWFSSNNQALL